LRKYLIAGNWKMNLLRDSSVALIHSLADQLSESTNVEVAVCPPSVYLHDVGAALRGTSIGLGAQNMHAAESGAFTGEISGSMLTDLGCQYVILGHSERRQLFGETDASVNEKSKVAFEHKLIPIVCVGETLEERESGTTAQVVETQVRGSLANLTKEQAAQVVVAYEPVWAIGTGLVATPADVDAIHTAMRTALVERFAEAGDAIALLYGGSVKPGNAAELLALANVNGALVGGASLKSEDFLGIVEAA
jgi:triosephosphate isomerase